jgi:hypothetical protein
MQETIQGQYGSKAKTLEPKKAGNEDQFFTYLLLSLNQIK